MRILFVNAIGFMGGAEKWIVHLTRRLVPRGHEVQVAFDPRSPLGELAREAGAEVWQPRCGFHGSARAAAALAREIREGRIDVVVSTTRTDLKIAGFAARLAGQPGVVARLNSGWNPAEKVQKSGWRWRRHRWYHRHLVQLAATNSRAGKADLVARDYLPEDRIVPIYNGVDFARFDPDRVEREPRRDDEELLRGFAARYFPGGSGPTMSLAVCMFTNTSDNHFVIDLHPDYPQVSFASPCSGHGFKFASVIGEIMADLAERGTTRHNIELFRLDRLLGGARGR